jgi:hypothetical protein
MHINKFTLTTLIAALSLSLSSCGSDDDENGTEVRQSRGEFFLAVKASSGTEYILQAESLDGDDLNIRDNVMELPQTEYTWIFDGNTAIGLVYQQQFAGIGYGLRLQDDKTLYKLGEFMISTRYSNYGFFDGQLVTSVAGQLSADGSRNDGATFAFWNYRGNSVELDHTQTLWTEDITGNGQQVTFSSIVDGGDGLFYTSMVQSAFNQTGTGNGSSVGEVAYPDSVWVAVMDRDLNIRHIFRDDRISYSAGSYRSQVFSQMAKVDDGTIYVFSSSYCSETTRPAGALRILPGAETFDPDYYYNLSEATNGYKFRRVWHMTGNKFLLEIYNDKVINTISVGHQFAVVDMQERDFKWVSGLPDKTLIVSGAETGSVPMFYNGKIYLPITQFKQDAALYEIDPETAVATKGITVVGASEIRTVGHLSN